MAIAFLTAVKARNNARAARQYDHYAKRDREDGKRGSAALYTRIARRQRRAASKLIRDALNEQD